MARISQDQVQERQAFLLDLFRKQPDLSRNEAMDAYKEKFGASLNAKTFNDLREQALSDRGAEEREERAAEPESEPESAAEESPTRPSLSLVEPATGGAQPVKKLKAKGVGPKNVFVDATQEQLQFLERVVQQLQEAGANNLRIDYATDRWMVLTVDTK